MLQRPRQLRSTTRNASRRVYHQVRDWRAQQPDSQQEGPGGDKPGVIDAEVQNAAALKQVVIGEGGRPQRRCSFQRAGIQR